MEDYPEIGATHTHTERTTPNGEVKQLEKRINNTQIQNGKSTLIVSSQSERKFFYIVIIN